MKSSKKLFKLAEKYIPGGVNSPVRAFSAVQSIPFFVKKAKGAYLTDLDNSKYIDYIGSWGAQILGHCDKRIITTLSKQVKTGITYGAPCEAEVELAKKVCKIFPSIDKVRMVNSGTEATMSAIRLARAFTKRDKIIKFDGCYHGHGDSFLIKAGSGASTFGQASSLGVSKSVVKDTISLPFNNIESVRKIVRKNKIACVIIEPIAGNMNFIRTDKSFLKELRLICNKEGIVLIFDEVMTGFRVALGGAQSLYKVKPDLTTLGKVIGGGLPVGAFGGKKEIMDYIAPSGPVYQAGTLSGNPLAMTAGLKTLEIISQKSFFKELTAKSKYLADGINEAAKESHKNIFSDYEGGMFGIYFGTRTVSNYQDIKNSNISKFIKFFNFMLSNGVFFAPSPYEAGFISSSHTIADLKKTISIFKKWIEG